MSEQVPGTDAPKAPAPNPPLRCASTLEVTSVGIVTFVIGLFLGSVVTIYPKGVSETKEIVRSCAYGKAEGVLDAWGNVIQTQDIIVSRSAGPDEEFGTSDDIEIVAWPLPTDLLEPTDEP